MKQIEITSDQAAEFIALGYTITCYANIPRAAKKGSVRRHSNKVMHKDEMFTYNIAGTPVAKGNYKAIWDKVVEKLWSKDVKAKYTREFIEDCLTIAGLDPADKSMFAFLVNKKGIIKRVAE